MSDTKAKLAQLNKDLVSANELIQRLEKNRKELAKKLEDEEVTYSIGDRFKDEHGVKYILVKAGMHRSDEVLMAALKSGNCWSSGYTVDNFRKITTKRLAEIVGCGDFTRYWDNRKKVEL